MSQHPILLDSCKSSNFKRGYPWQRPPIPFVPTKSSAPEGSPVKIKISDELTVFHLTFNGGTGEQYIKLLEDFESLVHKKVLRTIFKKLNANKILCQAVFDMHLLAKLKQQEWGKPVYALEYGLNTGQSSGKSQKMAAKGIRKPTGGQIEMDV